MFLSLLTALVVWSVVAVWTWRIWQRGKADRSRKVVGLLHPDCGHGGGGERVLWSAVAALVGRYGASVDLIVFGGDGKDENLRKRVNEQFGFEISERVSIVPLMTGTWTNPKNFPALTLLLQSLTGCVVTWEALMKRRVDILVETSAHAFAPFTTKLMGVQVLSYIHYPIISSDMLRNVSHRRVGVNNSSFVTSSVAMTKLKLLYYRLFAQLYHFAGVLTDVVTANSTWTSNHLKEIFGEDIPVAIVYPPCRVDPVRSTTSSKAQQRTPGAIVSLAQFRPEKNHEAQLEMMKILLQQDGSSKPSFHLHLIGGVRNAVDAARVKSLQEMCTRLELNSCCTFHLNLTHEEVMGLLSTSDMAIHTMVEEHFGIGVVELMAAGLLIVGHNSGGLRSDIIDHRETGFLAETPEEFAQLIAEAMSLSEDRKREMRKRAIAKSQKFSDAEFARTFLDSISPLLE